MELIEGLENINEFFDGVFPLLESMRHEIVQLGMFGRFILFDLRRALNWNEMCSQCREVTACIEKLNVPNRFCTLTTICNKISFQPRFTPITAKSILMY
jgi:hypothetical protein